MSTNIIEQSAASSPFSEDARIEFERFLMSQENTNRYRLDGFEIQEYKNFIVNPRAPAPTKRKQKIRWTAQNKFQMINNQLHRRPDAKHPVARYVLKDWEVFDTIVRHHCVLLGHAGRDKTFEDLDRQYYGITRKEVAKCLEHCATCAQTRPARTNAPLQSIVSTKLWERLQMDLVDYRHFGQQYKWCLHLRDHFSKFSAAYPLENKESQTVAHHLASFIGLFGPPEVIQCDNGTEFMGACLTLLQSHGIRVAHSRPRHPSTNGLIEQANGVLKRKIDAWMRDNGTPHWWLALPEVLMAMNRQTHSSTGKSPYYVVFKQHMRHSQLIATSQGLSATLDNVESSDGETVESAGPLHVPRVQGVPADLQRFDTVTTTSLHSEVSPSNRPHSESVPIDPALYEASHTDISRSESVPGNCQHSQAIPTTRPHSEMSTSDCPDSESVPIDPALYEASHTDISGSESVPGDCQHSQAIPTTRPHSEMSPSNRRHSETAPIHPSLSEPSRSDIATSESAPICLLPSGASGSCLRSSQAANGNGTRSQGVRWSVHALPDPTETISQLESVGDNIDGLEDVHPSFNSASDESRHQHQPETVPTAPEPSPDAGRIYHEVRVRATRQRTLMEQRYNNLRRVREFAVGDYVRLKIPRGTRRSSSDTSRLFCRIIGKPRQHMHKLVCQYGILNGIYPTRDLDALQGTIRHGIPDDYHQLPTISLHRAAQLHSQSQTQETRCACRSNCQTGRCRCVRQGITCTAHCHGTNRGLCCNIDGVGSDRPASGRLQNTGSTQNADGYRLRDFEEHESDGEAEGTIVVAVPL